ncbi:MAG: hypothetical protein RR237_06040, partial [Acetivibrio sp.]
MKKALKTRIISGLLVFSMIIPSLLPISAGKANAKEILPSGDVQEDGSSKLYFQGDGTETQIIAKGEFNNWADIKMTKDGTNLWSTTISGIQPGITSYGFYDDKDNNGSQTEGDVWIKDPSNPYHKTGDNPVLIYKCNPVVNQITGEVKIYYPTVETVSEGGIQVKYKPQGSQEAPSEVNMTKDGAYENMYSAEIKNIKGGTYEYELYKNQKKETDRYALAGQTFVIPEGVIKADTFINKPGGKSIWRITGNPGEMGSWDQTSKNGLFAHLVGEYYAKSMVLPVGKYEFKFTQGGSWENAIGNKEGGNITLDLSQAAKVNFYIKEREDGSKEVRTNIDSLEAQGIKQYIPTLAP